MITLCDIDITREILLAKGADNYLSYPFPVSREPSGHVALSHRMQTLIAALHYITFHGRICHKATWRMFSSGRNLSLVSMTDNIQQFFFFISLFSLLFYSLRSVGPTMHLLCVFPGCGNLSESPYYVLQSVT